MKYIFIFCPLQSVRINDASIRLSTRYLSASVNNEVSEQTVVFAINCAIFGTQGDRKRHNTMVKLHFFSRIYLHLLALGTHT